MSICLDDEIQRLQLFCRHKTDHLLTGAYRSVFKGQGMEFDDLRQYAPGDDIRSIDWRVTARTGDLYIKKFQEERQLNLIFIVDASAAFCWSSSLRTRLHAATQLCAALGSAAVANNDLIGMLRFGYSSNRYIKPSRGRSHLMRCLSELLNTPDKTEQISFTEPLQLISKLKLKRSVVVLISNFLHSNCFEPEFKKQLCALGRQHEVLAFALDDPRELELPASGLLSLSDIESKQTVMIDSQSKLLRDTFKQQNKTRLAKRQQLFKSANVDLLQHNIELDTVATLLDFFHLRQQRIANETGG